MAEQKKSCLAKILCCPASVFSQCLNPPRVTQDSIFYWYLPLVGGISYTAFSLNVVNPNTLRSIFPVGSHVAANILLFNAHLGSGLYLFSRKHLSCTPFCYRLVYSIYGAVLFNFGSVLFWAFTKVALPENSWLRGIYAVSASTAMLLLGKEYVNYVDSKVESVESAKAPKK